MKIKHLRKFKNTQNLYVIVASDIEVILEELEKTIDKLPEQGYWFSGQDLNDYFLTSVFVEDEKYVAFHTLDALSILNGQFLSDMIHQAILKDEKEQMISQMSSMFKR